MANINTVWREFGKHSEAGKLLFDLYGVKHKPTINIPVPKQKSKTNTALPTAQSRGKSVQRPMQAALTINYPETKKKVQPQISKIDMIVKRKPEQQIRDEMEKEKERFQLPINPPKNRKADIERLQDNFQFQERLVVPKGARMPGTKQIIQSEMKKNEMSLDNEKYSPKEFRNDPKTEMEYLYTKIIKEIDDRYKHIEEMKSLGKVDTQNVLLGEIRERIDELKSLEKMMNKK